MTWPPIGRDLNSFGGNWAEYEDNCYSIYYTSFYSSTPSWPEGKRFSVKRHPEYDGKCATFWHMVTEGRVEDLRTPALRRYERISWPRLMIDEFCAGYPAHDGPRVLWWKTKRGGSTRTLIALTDFSYLVVVEERKDYVMLWTAYPIEHMSQRRKLQAEYEAYWKSK